MPRPGEDRSDVGGAAQFNNIGPVPLSPAPAFPRRFPRAAFPRARFPPRRFPRARFPAPLSPRRFPPSSRFPPCDGPFGRSSFHREMCQVGLKACRRRGWTAAPLQAEQADDEGNEGVSQIPGVQAKSETLISRRIRETRIGLPRPAAASVSGWSHQRAGFGAVRFVARRLTQMAEGPNHEPQPWGRCRRVLEL